MRRSLFLLVLMIAWALGAKMATKFPPLPGKTIMGIASPGLAMQFATSPADVDRLLGPTKSGDDNGGKARTVVVRAQYADFVFILLYWAVFSLVLARALLNANSSISQRLGFLFVLSISLAAIADVLENVAILSIVGHGPQGWLPVWFGPYKWLFFFLALAFSAPLFAKYPTLGSFNEPRKKKDDGTKPQESKWPSRLGRIAGTLFLLAALTGLAGVGASFFLKDARPVAWAMAFYAPGFLSFLLLLVLETRQPSGS